MNTDGHVPETTEGDYASGLNPFCFPVPLLVAVALPPVGDLASPCVARQRWRARIREGATGWEDGTAYDFENPEYLSVTLGK